MGEIFHGFDAAEPLARNELDREGLTSLFDRYEWFARTHAECPLAGAPLIARASAEGVESWLFLDRDNRGRARGLSSWYTLSFRPVFRGNPNKEIRTELLSNIAKQLRQHVARIELTPMSADDCEMTADSFRNAGWTAIAKETGCNWTVNVAGKSFAQYWAERPGNLRKTVKSKGAKANLVVEIHTEFDAQTWRDYESIYAESWKPEEGSPEFLRDMAVTEGRSGTLRLGIGSIDGQAVAAQLWTCENGRAIAHKVAHLPSAQRFSAGTLLSAAMFEYVMDQDKVDCIDFGTGDSGYKSNWMDNRAPLYTLFLFNTRRVIGMIGAAKAKAQLKFAP
jgi:hypothetical protein